MKDLIIKNRDTIEADIRESNGNTFISKPVIAGADVDSCAVAFIEVPVGSYAFGYHYHDQSEEIFYIVSGEGILRTYQGEKAVKAGDMLCFPTGEKGSHVLRNSSETEILVFIDFGVKTAKLDVVTLPDIKKLMIVGEHINTMVDMPEE